MTILSETICGAYPYCNNKVFGIFCEYHSKLVEITPGEYIQLGLALRDALRKEK